MSAASYGPPRPEDAEFGSRFAGPEKDLLSLRTIAESCQDAVVGTTLTGIVEIWNDGAQALFGYGLQEILGRPVTRLVPPRLRGEHRAMVARIRAGEKIEPYDTVRLRKHGVRVDVSLAASPVCSRTGEVAGICYIARDLGERQRYESVQAELAAIVETSEDAIVCTDSAGEIRSWNQGAELLYGYAKAEALGRTLGLVLPPDGPVEEHEILRSITEGLALASPEAIQVRKDGRRVSVAVTVSPIRNSEGAITGAVYIARNITERAHLETSTAHLASIVESSEDAIISKNLNGVILTWNRGAERVYGYSAEEAIGKPMTILLPPDRPDEEAGILRRLTRGERVEHFETARMRKDGRQIAVSLTISPIRDKAGKVRGASHVARDISDRKALEVQLFQAQKLESLGVLAGGIAHDFNNLLTGIMGNASLALDSVPAANRDRGLLNDIVRAAERAADLTRQLLAYAGKGRFVTETVNLSELVREIIHLIRTSIPRKVRLSLDLLDDLPPIEADSGQIQQVIMNLVINAGEAIGDAPGTVTVTTAFQDVEGTYLRSVWGSNDLLPGHYVVLEVQDDGCGMDQQTITRIFDPFFTTKFTGRGLGLAAVMGIVRGHKGALRVYSAVGKGTTFKVLFPAAGLPPMQKADRSMEHDVRGTETVLVVDDEDIVRDTARNALEKYGYTVLLAKDGREAVELLRRAPDGIDLVLLDLTMPVMGGEEALSEMQRIRPSVKVLLSSGFNHVEAVGRFTGKGLAGFIQKPYAALELAARVRTTLDRAAAV